MTAIFKMLFDLSFLWAVTTQLLYDITEEKTHTAAFVFQMAVVVAFLLYDIKQGPKKDRRDRSGIEKRAVFAALLGIYLPFAHSAGRVIMYLVPWTYLCMVMLTRRYDTDYRDFTRQFTTLSPIFAAFFIFTSLVRYDIAGEAFAYSGRYVITYLFASVCVLRLIRAGNRQDARTNLIWIGAVSVPVVIVAFTKVPQVIFEGCKQLYVGIIAPLFYRLLKVVVYVAYYCLIRPIGWLISLIKNEEVTEVQIQVESGADILGIEEETMTAEASALWDMLLTILGVLLVAAIVYGILKLLLGKNREAQGTELYREEVTKAGKSEETPKTGFFRPRDPAGAIRWYYRKYLQDGIRKGAYYKSSLTTGEISENFGRAFHADQGEVKAIYDMARYRHRESVTKDDAKRAGEVCKEASRAFYVLQDKGI